MLRSIYRKINIYTGIATMLSLVSIVSVSASQTIGSITSSPNIYPSVCHDTYCDSYGKLNMRPTLIYSSTSPITITDNNIYGYAYGNEIGWVNFAPTIASATISAVKVNPSTGVVTGYAYSQLGSWINFSPSQVAGSDISVGVSINATGQFNGWAWVSGINGGWMKFDCISSTSTSCITTDWRPLPNRTSSPSVGGGGGYINIVNNNATSSNVNNSTSNNSNSNAQNTSSNNVNDSTNTGTQLGGGEGNTYNNATHNDNAGQAVTPQFPNNNDYNFPSLDNLFNFSNNTYTPEGQKALKEEFQQVFPVITGKYEKNKPCFFCAVLRHEEIGQYNGSTINSQGLASNVSPVYNTPILKIAVVPKTFEVRVPISESISKALKIVNTKERAVDVDLTSIALISIAGIGLWRMIIIRAVSVFLKL